MKIFKKILAGIVSAAVIVSALTVPTAALTTTPKTKTQSGTFKAGNRTYTYGGDLVASSQKASATTSSEHNMPLFVEVLAFIHYGDLTLYNEAEDVIFGTSVSVQVNNKFDTPNGIKTVNIEIAQGQYKIGSIDNFNLTIT